MTPRVRSGSEFLPRRSEEDLPALERRVRHDARVVEDHVDAAVLLDRSIDKRLDLRRIGYVGDTRGRLAARSGDLVDQRLEAIGAPRAQYYRRAAVGKVPRCRLAQATAGAGDDDDFPDIFVLSVSIVGPTFSPEASEGS
jgi:hypothetical protein